MVAAPRYGTVTFKGASGKTYSVDVYLSDVANAQVNWDSGNGAGTGSQTFWRAPENVVLIDFSVASGLTDTTNIVLTKNGGQLAGQRIRYANYLNSLAFRAPLTLGFSKDSNIGAIQIA